MSEIDHIQAALERAKANIRDVRAEIDGAAPPCKTCRYVAGGYFGECGHPAVVKVHFNATSGDVFIAREQTWRVRSAAGLCGVTGVLFETAPPAMRRKRWARQNLCWAFPIGAFVFLAWEVWMFFR